jgi:photosystem II stability/assembly factor-like uncharacterized protein
MLRIFSAIIIFHACVTAVQAQWQQCTGTAGLSVRCFTVKNNLLFAGTDSGVFFSADTGSTWAPRSNGITSDTVLSMLASGNSLFAGTQGGGIFHSADNGLNWAPANNGITNNVIHCFTKFATKIFAGADSGNIFLSTDSGSSWTLLNSGISQSAVNALAANDSNVFAAHDFGIFYSPDSGTTWTTTGITVTNFLCMEVHGSEIYAGAGGDGVFYTTDNFATWSMIDNGMTNTLIKSLAASDSVVFAGSDGNGVYSTTDHGNNWMVFNSGLADLFVQAFVVSNGYVFGGTQSSGIWRRALTEITYTGEMDGSQFNPVIFPNPVREIITVEFCTGIIDAPGNKHISIYDLFGRPAMQKIFPGNQCSFNVACLPSGVYVIEIKSASGVIKKKIIKL